MLRTIILLQLTLWVASIHAFFPFVPAWQCEENGICEEDPSPETAPKVRDVHTYKLSQLSRDVCTDQDPAASATKEASRLLRKFKPSEPDLTRRGNKYNVVPPQAPSTPHSAGIYQDGTDFSYFIEVGVGSAATPMYMLLDTGAGTTWVMGSNCESEACQMHNTFGPSSSKTYQGTKDSFSIHYGSGNVTGVLAKDTLSMAGMSLSMSFGVASDTSRDFKNFPFDGILGVSMSRGATDNFLTVVGESKVLQSNMFGVFLSRSSDGVNTGEVTFGGIDDSKYTGPVTYSPVSAEARGDWAIPMDGMAYDGTDAGVKNRLAYLDTGTSYIFGPPEDVAALHKLIPGAKGDNNGFAYKVPCDSIKTLTITFSGVAYTLSPKDWMSPPAGGVCTSNFYGQAVVKDSWLLGDSFLKNVYSVFDVDQKRIGLAPAAGPTAAATTSDTSGTTTTSVPDSPTPSASLLPGLSGHETSATQGTPVAQTGGPEPTPTGAISPGEQLEGNRYASILCIVAVIAMVA
ncbi:aspartic peptidase domain-containing protein [Coniochaeta sp. 2T2.1]|nr:aspartic peptidase domain-containing protein [Coniochaeta sp. 2T2.1]